MVKGKKMTIVGIIIEYNPFHNGHKYHLERIKEKTKADVIIGVMSGDYVQRGEPSIVNRFLKSEMALKGGVDLIVELPSFYSTQSGEIFALGGVGILKELGVDTVVFGSESDDIVELEKIASLGETEEFKTIMKAELKKGFSYPTSYSNTLDILKIERKIDSNDILGIEYIKARNTLAPEIKIKTIKRINTGYYDSGVSDNIASATGIRKKLFSNESIVDSVPYFVKEAILKEKKVKLEEYYPFIKYEILNLKSKLAEIQDIEIGFENKLFESAKENSGFENFFKSLISKRYTIGRIQRILIHILLGITKEMTNKIKYEIPYIRVLGFNERGQKHLKLLKVQKKEVEELEEEMIIKKEICGFEKNFLIKKMRERKVTIITGTKNIKINLTVEEKKYFEFNEKNSEIYKMINPYDDRKRPIILEEKEWE